MTDVTVAIEGMDCGHCAARVESALTRLEGVRDVQADADEDRARVRFVAGKEDPAALQGPIEDLGFSYGGVLDD